MDLEKNDKYDIRKSALFIFECAMAGLYLCLSVALLFTSFFNRTVPEGLRIGVGIVIGLYGLFRVYRAYLKITQKMDK